MSNTTAITNARRLAFGPEDNLMNMSRTKYKWADEIYQRMEANTWFPKSVPMNDDRLCYRERLTPAERNAYDKALAFVSNLDGIQFNNLIHNIGLHVTAPEVKLCLARQAAEEGVHVRSYQTMIEAVAMNPEDIYMMFARDGMLAKKNEYIMRASRVLRDEPTPANFARSIVGNVALEGIYFYSAFLLFYILGRDGKMLGSSDMIRYINRDEGETHLDLFTHMHHTFREENPEVYDDKFVEDARFMLGQATALEVEWWTYLVGEGIPGATQELGKQFICGLANERSQRLGLGILYPGADYRVAVPWFNAFSKPNSTKTNFFEGKPTDYAVDGLSWD